MIFSIKASLRALLCPKHRINCQRKKWLWLLNELEQRGQQRHEAGVFLLGFEYRGRMQVAAEVFYDELDARAYSTGVCVLTGESFAKLWEICRRKKLTVIADIHTHPGEAYQSSSDQTNPMVARTGHIAIIIPNYAKRPLNREEIGIYEYCGNHNWTDHSHPHSTSFLYTGFWS